MGKPTLPVALSQRNSGFAPGRRSGPVQPAALRSVHAAGRGAQAPRRDTRPPPTAAATGPGSPGLLCGTAASFLPPAPRPEPRGTGTHPAGGKRHGCVVNQRPVRLTSGTQCEPGRETSLSWGTGGVPRCARGATSVPPPEHLFNSRSDAD